MGTQKFLGRRLGALAMPVLCLAGELDDKFSDEANAIATGAPRAQVRLVANAQHAAHLEEPVACARLVTAFLDD
jgi:pimeloyl-ACP methyl ester carboxylesterase